MHRRIQVFYCRQNSLEHKRYSDGEATFTDWFEFADWLKQATLKAPVLITYWQYVDPEII